MTTARQTLIDAFLGDFLDDYRVESLPGDASFRRYHRVFGEQGSFLLMDAPPDKEDVAHFAKVADVFATVVNTPDILKRDDKNGFLLLQDFGSVEFAHKIGDDDRAWYDLALQTLRRLQDAPPDLPLYSDALLKSEMRLFWDWFLPYIDVKPSQSAAALWEDLGAFLVETIQKAPKTPVHRDYHSRNLMIDGQTLGVIDFQDAQMGSYAYDVVSLLRDAYIQKDEAWVSERLAAAYAVLQIQNRFGLTFEDFARDVNAVGAQRHLKVLGIFVRLCVRDGKQKYLANIPKTMRDLRTELVALRAQGDANDVCGRFLRWLDADAMPAYRRKFKIQ